MPATRPTATKATKATTEGLIAGIDRPELLEIYYELVLTRFAEERLDILTREGHISGGVYGSLGQEAGAVGGAYVLRRRSDGTGDVLAHTHRGTGAVLMMGGEPVDLFRQYLARATGPSAGRDTNLHWGNSDLGLLGPIAPLGVTVQVMAGITLSFKIKGEDRVGLVFCGDGATSTGAWHEGLAFAAAQRCPLVLVVEANQWAFSTPMATTTRLESFTAKAAGYGLHAASVDGTDVLAVIEATRSAVERARTGDGVGMVELRYYRRVGHAQHDDQAHVDPEEIRAWEAKDPIERYRQRLLADGRASEDELQALTDRALHTIDGAVEQALGESVPEGSRAAEGVYTDVATLHPWSRLDDPVPPSSRRRNKHDGEQA